MSDPAPVPHDRPFPPGAFEPYVPAVIPPDPARDARVAARRARDARRAGEALDILINGDGSRRAAVEVAYYAGWNAGHAACGLHHNRHYGVCSHDCDHPSCQPSGLYE